MKIERIKLIAATVAGGAVLAAAAVVGAGAEQQSLAGGSGDSSTTATYVQPSASAMQLPATTVETPVLANGAAPTTLAIPMAAPTYKATAAPGCVNNGQCP